MATGQVSETDGVAICNYSFSLQRAELKTQGNQQEFGKKNRPKEETCLVSMDLVRILGPSPCLSDTSPCITASL